MRFFYAWLCLTLNFTHKKTPAAGGGAAGA